MVGTGRAKAINKKLTGERGVGCVERGVQGCKWEVTQTASKVSIEQASI